MHDELFHDMESMVNVLDLSAYFPGPDDPGTPWGPLGPIAQILQRFNIAALNPQPLPPIAGPDPIPWLAASQARAVINQTIIRSQMAEMRGETGGAYRETVGKNIGMLVDWYCGTPPRKWPFPWPPPPWWSEGLRPDELVMAGLQFKVAAACDTPFQSEFAKAADQLMEAGMSRM